MKILLTGGLGYIGSHTAVELLEGGHQVVIVDNLSNSSKDVKKKIELISGKKIHFYQYDLLHKSKIDKIFKCEKPDAVIHFAGLKSVSQSVKKPIEYYENNIGSTINLLKSMSEHNCKNIIFSSSATVYGKAEKMPVTEDLPTSATNPYGRTKLFIEDILKDLYISDPTFNIVILRYFNPIGAHKSGIIGEDPNDIPNNLVPYIARVSLGLLKELSIYGDDYNTKDGTGVRDYIHVVDLAQGHVKALKKLKENGGLNIYNLGTGKGYSVLEVVKTYNKVCNNKVTYKIAPRRPGDIDVCYADAKKAQKELGWKAEKTIKEMCEDSYRFSLNKFEEKKGKMKKWKKS